MFWMYMLRCCDESFYIGHTDNLEQRLVQHAQGAVRDCYTYWRRPVSLAFSQPVSNTRRRTRDGAANQWLEPSQEGRAI
jgi:predicted GIY-YIG superfamily endonuclease